MLLKTLAGHTRTLVGASASGSAFLNGAPLKSTWAVALQPQDNSHLIGVLTVRESLNYSLKLKKPRMSQQERDARVNEVLSNLGLNACQDTQVSHCFYACDIFRSDLSGCDRLARSTSEVFQVDNNDELRSASKLSTCRKSCVLMNQRRALTPRRRSTPSSTFVDCWLSPRDSPDT